MYVKNLAQHLAKATVAELGCSGLKHKTRRGKEIPTIQKNPNRGLFRTKEGTKENWEALS